MTIGGALPSYPHSGLVEQALDLIFPPVCVGCRRVGRWVCERCWEKVPWMLGWTCGQCGRGSVGTLCRPCAGGHGPLEALVAVAEFEGIGREAIHALKYHDRHAISGMLGKVMAQAAGGAEVDVVVPVPLHRRRRRERGYDQATMLAKSVARTLARPHESGLQRTRATQQQALLDAAARRANVAGAFESRRPWKGEAVLLVDDVSTTGATIESAADALKQAGAGPITGLVFAYAR